MFKHISVSHNNVKIQEVFLVREVIRYDTSAIYKKHPSAKERLGKSPRANKTLAMC